MDTHAHKGPHYKSSSDPSERVYFAGQCKKKKKQQAEQQSSRAHPDQFGPVLAEVSLLSCHCFQPRLQVKKKEKVQFADLFQLLLRLFHLQKLLPV